MDVMGLPMPEKEKITKAVECCIEYSRDNCRDNCPYFDSVYDPEVYDNCREELLWDVLRFLKG